MKKLKAIKNKLIVMMSIISMTIYNSISYVLAEENGFTKAANEASEGIKNTGMSMTKPLLIIVSVIIGLIFIIGTQRQKDEVKERIPLIILGVALILGSSIVAATIYGWF